MAIQDLRKKIARLPEQPGVYIWVNKAGRTIYVGKARSLRARVKSYLSAWGTSRKIEALLKEISDLEIIVTDSVIEALALENHLIKERAPKFNVLLRDDKNYPYLKLTTSETFPRLIVARQIEQAGDFYAGPFLPSRVAHRTMGLAHRLFGIRSCNEIINGDRGRPCLEYDIKRCVAPCVSDICSEKEYQEAVYRSQLFLEGRNDELVKQLHEEMENAAEAERFEEAARLRDAVRDIQAIQNRQQKISTISLGDRDIFGLKLGLSGGVVQVFSMRRGRVVERFELLINSDAIADNESDVLETALQQFYEVRMPPKEIHVSNSLENIDLLVSWLSSRGARKVQIKVPRRGDKRALVDLAIRNAKISYQAHFNANTAAHFEALEKLRLLLRLPVLPRRIESVDVSNIQGSETVASLVVCEDGRMKKKDYRKFRIKGNLTDSDTKLHRTGTLPVNDYAAIREVIHRRYRALLDRGGPFPDLILVDGGKGQLSVSYEALEEIGLGNLLVVGIAKREELLYVKNKKEPIVLDSHDPALLLVRRIRDEAHRFAITFHRHSRMLRDLRSELDAIPGIGSKRRKALLNAFGSVSGVRRATLEEVGVVVGPRVAAVVIDYFSTSA